MSYKIIVQDIELDFGEDEIDDEDIKILQYIREERVDLEDIKQAFDDSETLYDQFEDEYLDSLKY